MENREDKMVVIKRDADGKAVIWCDPEIVDLVTALNDGGLRTSASCSGHGYRPGRIMLADGRELFVARDQQDVECIEAAFPLDINGHSKAERDAWAAASDGGADTVTPTQADIDAAHNIICAGPGNASKACGIAARHRLTAEATQAAEIARLREALGYMLRAWDCEVGEDVDVLLMVKEGSKVFSVASARAALSAQPVVRSDRTTGEQLLPNDVVRLVIAARTMAFGDWCCEGYEVARKELDNAAEAFASRVEWPDTPSEQEGGE
jgi:hypothetical protein